MIPIRPTYLIMVTAENNNKYYNCFPNGDTFRVEYGRVDSTKTETSYPIYKWESQIQSKLKKGYKDVTDLKTALVEEISKDGDKTYKQIENESVRRIIEKLQSIARDTVRKNYTIKASAVTQEMVDSAQKVIDELATTKYASITAFNTTLLKLFAIIPRKMDNVRNYLATSMADYDTIVRKEQDLLDTMRGQIYVPSEHTEEEEKEEDKSAQTILDEMGIEMRECTADEIAEIKKCMNESAYHFSRAWRVTHKESQKKFDNFVKANNIKETKLLFHGSRSENWYSILKTGLKIRPSNAVFTGSMFGSGIYYAPKCQKSIGYTSLGGSYWANGNDKIAYMALFDTAYGKPYNVYSFDSKYYSMNYRNLPTGCNCLHAHAGNGMLRNDEIVYYREDQSTIKYLIEIK